MTKTLPDFLRVHHENTSDAKDTSTAFADDKTVEKFWHAYKEVTGWRIDSADMPSRVSSPVRLHADIEVDLHNNCTEPQINKLSAQRLADSANTLAGQLADAQETIRIQSAELAARCALTTQPTREGLAETLANSLCDTVAALRCDAAAIYLLDDNTENLTLRAMHGLPTARLGDSPRPLQGSRGDLEAMVQGVVTISDLNECSVDTWSCPENASSAICAAIVNAGVPVGTLWMFFNTTQSLDDSHAAVARMAVGSIGSQLQLAASSLMDGPASSVSDSADDTIDDLAQWQFAGLPLGTQLAPNWRVDGMIESPQPWATGWHAWDVLPDGSLMIAIAEAEDKTVAGSMVAAIARAGLEAHAGYRHTPEQILQRVSDTLWQTNTMDQLTSMMYVRIDPETGEGEIASAGNMIAMIAGRYGYRPAVQQNDSPLASQIDLNSSSSTFRLTSGEVLMAYGIGFAADDIGQTSIGNCLREAMQKGESCPLASVRRSLAGTPMNNERGAITILRQ